MKLLVVGCGSIGSRHAMNASTLAEEVAVVDRNPLLAKQVADNFGIKSFSADLNTALAWRPDGVIVAVPHKYHVKVALSAVEAGADVLVEKPISHDLDEASKLLASASKAGKHIYVVCNMRFHPAIQALKVNLPQIGRPLFARAHYGNYLPDMRLGIDYRKLYVADIAEGGVILDGIHEVDYLSWLLGPVKAVMADAGKISDLEIEAEDYASLQMQHVGGIKSEVHLDYVRRVKRRGCEIAGTDGVLDWLSEGKKPEECKVRLYTPNDGWRTVLDLDSVDAGAPLKAVMAKFVAAISDRNIDLHTGEEALRVLRVSCAAKEKTGNVIQIP